MVFTHPRDAIPLKSDNAMALSLMLNELLTNAIKYGAPSAESPVTLEVEVTQDDALQITVSNADLNGTFPEQGSPSSGTGERLVQQFATQLGADVTRERDGTRVVARVTVSLGA